MKKIIFLSAAVFILTFVFTVSAADIFLIPGERYQSGDTTIHCQSCYGNCEPIEVTSSVDLQCIETLYDDYFPGSPSWDELVMWARFDCRTAPLDQYRCVILKSTFNRICYEDLTSDHNGFPFPTNNDLRAIQDACKDVVLNCR